MSDHVEVKEEESSIIDSMLIHHSVNDDSTARTSTVNTRCVADRNIDSGSSSIHSMISRFTPFESPLSHQYCTTLTLRQAYCVEIRTNFEINV